MQDSRYGQRSRPSAEQEGRPKTVIRLVGYHRSDCGYCNLGNESISFGALSQCLLVDDYLRMMHKGWRRSGKYLYKPTNFATCCPCYTIRLRVADFQISKSQRKVLKNMDRFLNKKFTVVTERNSDGKGAGPDAHGGESKNHNKKQKMTAGFKSQSSSVGKGEAHSNLAQEQTQEKFEVDNNKIGSERLTVETVDAECTDERFELYKKYQIQVHKDKPEDLTRNGFTRFLVESPLVSEERTDATGRTLSFGCKHQLYRLDGRLVAVGVIDLLPDGLSSVYTYYDPNDRELVLGKFTALKEIEFTKEVGLEYYYMGFYIHDCQKMRYKAEYKPSELLCGTSLEWFPYAACKPLMDQDQEGSGFSVYTPFHPSYLQVRAELGLSSHESMLIKLKTELAAKTALQEKEERSADEKADNVPAGDTDMERSNEAQLKEETKELASDGKEEEGGEEDISGELLRHALLPLAPQFPNSNASMVEQVPFSIGGYEGLQLRHLKSSAANIRIILEGYLRDYILNCGGDFAKAVMVNFN